MENYSKKTKLKLISKFEVEEVLRSIEYVDKFKKDFFSRSYKINYGSRIGEVVADSFIDMANKYAYSNEVDNLVFSNWNKILNNVESSEEQLFITCLEIFDWGKVWNGNIKKAIDLYKKKQLKEYIFDIRLLLKSDEVISNFNKELIWTSGWTKVYSFMSDNIVIYDSRVSAFLNYTLTHQYLDLEELKKITPFLYNFKGVEERKRKVDNCFGLKNSNPTGISGFNANLVSSWVLEFLRNELQSENDFRLFERAFFMLGFDLDQIND